MAARSDSTGTFTIYPAIDVLAGRVVRLAQGDPSKVTVEGGDPMVAATRFAAEGANWLHLVDLDGAFRGSPTAELVRRVASAISVPIQVGGGYRTLASIAAALEAGATRVLVGTAALSPDFLQQAVERFGERLVVAVDVRDGRIAVQGWTERSTATAAELAEQCRDAGVARLLVTSTSRDGSLAGPDLELLATVLETSRLPVLAAGGIASLDDLRAVRDLGCEGAVAGSALWRGRFTLGQAISLEA
ncbi:MAG: 1-(5-phosphoribosyl)-5-[(5-phosphoribosylamino)methylideneamino] imidazole-4-carboxamide isomerase [Gaiellaceae bacterium MAG52_C11]|nr:1-(5-phosphoribosyl)-5-[(5-phosphoribosylamino)methylideneamino] imidazole-4-carboxamide isomerase [Candidatus Gaiellasilicea maunaloa]